MWGRVAAQPSRTEGVEMFKKTSDQRTRRFGGLTRIALLVTAFVAAVALPSSALAVLGGQDVAFPDGARANVSLLCTANTQGFTLSVTESANASGTYYQATFYANGIKSSTSGWMPVSYVKSTNILVRPLGSALVTWQLYITVGRWVGGRWYTWSGWADAYKGAGFGQNTYAGNSCRA